jgi:hypothetical protein
MKLPYGRRVHERAGPTWRPMSAWSWMLAALAAVVITAFLVTTWLLTIANHANPGTDRANARLDAVRTGLATAAGVGAAVGLMLAFRRQHHQEIATDLTNRDATERRITELYTKAVEQLGNDKGAVRLGGLYALERLAQDNPAQRQVIVDVICAYLRMPFFPTAPPKALDAEREAAWQQERQVRRTAQRILAEHLREDRAKDQQSTDPSSPRFWPSIRLNLAGATLVDFEVGNCVIADADFYAATFSGNAQFFRATFSGDALFSKATFSGNALFVEATFSGDNAFVEATFRSDAVFRGATFSGMGMFAGATFDGNAWFDRATFGVSAWFGQATFGGGTAFDEATFGGSAVFDGATFSTSGSLSFKRSCVLSSDARHAWLTGWSLGADGSGGYTVVRTKE